MTGPTQQAPAASAALHEPAGPWARRAALAVVVISALLLAIVVPIVDQPWVALPAFIPAYQAAVAVIGFVTATLLFGLFRELRRVSLLLLAGGYLLTATLVVAQALSFPGLPGPGSLIGGPQATAWLWVAWHVPLPLMVCAYALLADGPRDTLPAARTTAAMAMAILLPLAVAGLLIVLATAGHDRPPALLDGERHIAGVMRPALAVPLVLSVAAAILLALRTRLGRAMHLWLAVAMGAWAIEILLTGVLNSGHFQAGFYVGRLYGLLACCTVMVALILTTAATHGRLSRAVGRERDAARAALSEREAGYRSLLDSIDSGFCILEMKFDGAQRPIDYRFLEVNPNFAKHTGLVDAAGKWMRDLAPSHEQHWFDIYGRIALTGEPARFEHRAQGLGDRIYDVHAFRSGDPAARRVAVLFDDITDRRRAEAALRDNEARFQAFVTTSSDVVYWMSPDWTHMRELDGNGFLADTFEPSDGWLDRYIHPDDQSMVKAAIARAISTRTLFELEHRVRRADGDFGWTMSRAIPILGADGEISEWLGAASDITARKDAEAALQRLNEELERRVRDEVAAREAAQRQLVHAQRMEALGQLAGGIAHDINNVLQAVDGGAALIERRASDPEAVRRLARMVIEATERGSAVTRRLLTFSRRGDLRAEALDPVLLLADMREILTHTLGTGIRVRVQAPPGLPPVLADKGQLETVLVNLATNARDAMEGQGTITFTAGAWPGDGSPATPEAPAFVCLSVTDAGPGMAPEVLTHATEPFFTTKELGKGTGLGLAMARGFAEQSGGGLQIESEPGRGTTVSLWLPLAGDTPAAGAPRHTPADGAGMQGGNGQLPQRILLVDDDAAVREITAEGLRAAGYVVVTAASGSHALALLDAGEAVELLVCDLSMPGMDGLATIGEAQRRRPALPAILLTGFATNAAELAMSGTLGGTFSLLRKPITVQALGERIAVLLEGTEAEP